MSLTGPNKASILSLFWQAPHTQKKPFFHQKKINKNPSFLKVLSANKQSVKHNQTKMLNSYPSVFQLTSSTCTQWSNNSTKVPVFHSLITISPTTNYDISANFNASAIRTQYVSIFGS